MALHNCSTCNWFSDSECLNLCSFRDLKTNQIRRPRPDDLCDEYEANPEKLTARLMRVLIHFSRQC